MYHMVEGVHEDFIPNPWVMLCCHTAGDLPVKHIETFNANSYFKGVSIPEPDTNVSSQYSNTRNKK